MATAFDQYLERVKQNVPASLLSAARWLVTRLTPRGDKFTKPPFRANDGIKFDAWDAEPFDLSSLDIAFAALEKFKFELVGFCVTGTSFLVADLDHCFTEKDGDDLKPWAAAYINEFRSSILYAERTPSRDGLHLWMDLRTTPKNPNHRKVEVNFTDGKIELFARNYVTVTGDAWGNFDGLPLDQRGYEHVWNHFIQKDASVSVSASPKMDQKKYALLLEGKLSEAGFTDRSDADLSLCGHLARKGLERDEVKQIWLSCGLKRDKQERADYVNRTLDRAFAGIKPKATVLDGSDWRAGCRSLGELSTNLPEFLLKYLVPAGALTGIVAPSYNCKTWFALAQGKAISTGDPLWGFDGPAEPVPVIYHVPEMNEAFVRQRMVTLEIKDSENFLVRPMERGLWPLNDPRMLKSSEGRAVFLDTAGYFNPAEDTSSYQQSLEFAKLVFKMLSDAGCRAVVALFHPPKSASQDKDKRFEWTLENSILGSAGYGGILRSCLRMKNLSLDLNDSNVWVYVQGLKNPGLKPFQLQGLPLEMKSPPNESPYLRDLNTGIDPDRAKAFAMFKEKKTVDSIRKLLRKKNQTISQWKKEFEEEAKADSRQAEIEMEPPF